MRVKKVMATIVLLAAGLLNGYGFALAADGASTAPELDKIQEQVRVLDKDLAVLKEISASKLDAQDKRLSDIGFATAQHANHLSAISNQTTAVGNYIAWTSGVITLLVLAAGFITYFSAKNKAEKEAREASTKWFNDHSTELRKEIDQLREQAKQAVDGISQQQARVAASADAAHESIKGYADSILSYKPADDGDAHRIDAAAEKAVNRVSDELKEKPESSFTAEDHFARGLSQFANENHFSALESFKAASRVLPATAALDEGARYLFAQAVTLGALGNPKEAISVYDEIDRSFGNEESPGVRELVAKGLSNKAVTLGELGKFEDELTVYDEIDSRFGNDRYSGVREQVARALSNKGVTLGSLGKCDAEIAVYDAVDSRFGKDESPKVREQVVRGLANKGVRLGALSKFQEALAVYDAIDSRFGKDESPEVREQMARGLFNKGVMLGALSKFEDELAVYEAIDRRFGQDETPGVRESVVKAIFNKGIRLVGVGKLEEAIALYDAIDGRFAKDESPEVRQQVARALLNKGVALGALGKAEEAIAVYDGLDSRFGKDGLPGLRQQVARGLLNKGVALGALGKVDEAIAVYDGLDSRFGKDESPGLREQVARALVNKGVVLGALGEVEEAIAVYDGLDSRFGKDELPGIRDQVGRARSGVAFRRIMGAKQHWQEASQKAELLASAIKGLQGALLICHDDDRAMMLGNLGYALLLSGDSAAAAEPTRECLRLGGETSLAAQRGDTQQHRVEPEDSNYEALLGRLWAELHPKKR